jgi:hypothetical protein
LFLDSYLGQGNPNLEEAITLFFWSLELIEVTVTMNDRNMHRIFLDTNIVWFLDTFSEEIYDNVNFDENSIVARIGRRGPEDLRALRGITEVAGCYGSIEFVTAPETISELEKKAHNDRGIRRMYWGIELLDWWLNEITINHPEEDFKQSKRLAQRLLNSQKLDFLPDSEDKFLILTAVARNCGVFLTMDYKSIWNLKNKLESISPLLILRPSEYWSYVEKLL